MAEQIRLIGSGGAPLLLTVGSPFSAEFIEKRLADGTWKHAESAPKRRSKPAAKRTTRKA